MLNYSILLFVTDSLSEPSVKNMHVGKGNSVTVTVSTTIFISVLVYDSLNLLRLKTHRIMSKFSKCSDSKCSLQIALFCQIGTFASETTGQVIQPSRKKKGLPIPCIKCPSISKQLHLNPEITFQYKPSLGIGKVYSLFKHINNTYCWKYYR